MYEQEQLKALIETAVDGVLSISADGRVRLYNKASERMFGYPAEDVLGRDVAMLMPEMIAASHAQYINNYLETGKQRIIGIGREVEGKRADGTIFPLHLSVGEFRDKGERFFVGIVRDLTREVETRQRNQAMAEQLDLIGRHSAVSEMGAALAHELNQPLTAIDLFLAAAEIQLEKDPEKARETFQRVRSEATRAGNIVRRIREMVERSDSDRCAFDVRDVINDAVQLCRMVERKDTVISVEPLSPASVFGEPTQIQMIIVNLVKNALDATDGQQERKVSVRMETGDQRVRICVLDNGPGVTDEFAAQLFEPFQSTKKKGLGIGLSICSTIAEGHEGKLSYLAPPQQVESLGGAAFLLDLPLYKDEIHD